MAFALTGVMAFAIPDVPREINVQIQREKVLASEALYETDLAKLQREKGSYYDDSEKSRSARRGSSIAQDLLINFNKESLPPDRIIED